MTTSHESLEQRVAQFFTGTSLPETEPENQYARSFFLDTATNVLYFRESGSTEWVTVTQSGTPTNLTVGGSNAAGVATTFARSDHTHALPDWGAAPPSISTAAATGSATTFARSDHTHDIGNNAVTTATIASGAVTADKLGTSAVTSEKIASLAVTKAKIATEQQLATGMVMPFAGSSTPTGWALCDGTAYSTTASEYAALFAVIGTTYGSAGAGTFRVPNLVNYFLRGGTPGSTGGQDSNTLTEANLPAHTHSLSTGNTTQSGSHGHVLSGTTDSEPNHGHNLLYGPQLLSRTNVVLGSLAGTNTGGFLSASGIVNVAQQLTANDFEADGGHSHDLLGNALNGPTSEHTHSLTGNTASTGSGTSFTNLPAFVAMRYIIKL
jgi:microcystin-dependent protein